MGWNVTERQEKDDLESLNSKEENMEQVNDVTRAFWPNIGFSNKE